MTAPKALPWGFQSNIKIEMIFKRIPILIVLCASASILVILFYLLGYNVLTVPPKSSEQLLEDHLQIDNVSSEENIDKDGLVSALLPPKLSYFQFQLSFSANFKNDKNIMNTEIALSTVFAFWIICMIQVTFN